MRVPLSWLREWVDWPGEWDARELGRRLTFAGFEIEAIEPAAPAFHGVVVARIESVAPHPQADKLRICRVLVDPSGTGAALQIVCGAANVRRGLTTALAQAGAQLPDGTTISTASKRGVESQGMLCSARELGLAETSEGILELPEDAPLGRDLRRYLDLDDQVLEVNVTPNRGDAMSILGIAREVAALCGAPLAASDPEPPQGQPDRQHPQHPQSQQTQQSQQQQQHHGPVQVSLAVTLQPGAGAGRLLAASLRGVDNSGVSPLWLRERLRRAGLRSISPVVDVTNCVMLELGQPLHAYDLAKLGGVLSARRARAGERLQLLDGRDVLLAEDVLVIADEAGPVGLAGIMGGTRSSISAESRDIVLEAAWFAPAAIVGRARRYGLTTDASQRFERGVDWRGQQRALERAVRLIRQLTRGLAGATVTAEAPLELPRASIITLRESQVQRLLGVIVAPAQIEQRLRALAMTVHAEQADRDSGSDRDTGTGAGAGAGGRTWRVQPPSWRFDIAIEADLIEEVARLGGLEHIEERDALIASVPRAPSSPCIEERVVLGAAAARGYQEIISYAFVDPALQSALCGEQAGIKLANPIASDLAVLRASLWPGLISAARENLRRQQQRIRLFEIGTRFAPDGSGPGEQKMLAGLALGTRLPEQWGSPATPLDFHDVKADLLSLLALAAPPQDFSFEPGAVSCLHPGRSARVRRAGQTIGMIGELHPSLVGSLDLTYVPLLFELSYAAAFRAELPRFREISRFPRIRRDISITLPQHVAFASVRERVTVVASSLLKELRVFDVYHGDVVESGRKSLALGLILQDLNCTLTDEDADRVVGLVLADLRAHLDARIREQRRQ